MCYYEIAKYLNKLNTVFLYTKRVVIFCLLIKMLALLCNAALIVYSICLNVWRQLSYAFFAYSFGCTLFYFIGGRKMICKNCGKEIDDSSKFCEYCGAKLKQKKKRSKTKKIILSVLSVIILIVLAFASRYLLFGIASKGIDKMKNSASIDSLTVYDDSLDVNITNNYSNPLLFHCTDYIINLNIYTNNEDECIGYYRPTDIDKSGSQFDGTYWNNNHYDEIVQSSYGDNCFDFEEGEIYKINISIQLEPLGHMKSEHQGRRIISDIDYYISNKIMILTDIYTSYLFRNSIDIESYFLYENGEFIKVNE